MIKTFLILLIFPILLFSSQQLLLVVADDFNTSHASLECIEDGKVVLHTQVNLGKNGLGWGVGILQFKQKKEEPLKYEGDKKAPAGVFRLTDIFGYAHHNNYKLPYLYTSERLICVDDITSPFYNQIIEATGNEKSFEQMHREDALYTLGVVVAHNKKAIKGRGSCIFLHIQREDEVPTVGCTSMKYKDLKKIVKWLDKKKNPLLIQLPKSHLEEAQKHYPQLKASRFIQ